MQLLDQSDVRNADRQRWIIQLYGDLHDGLHVDSDQQSVVADHHQRVIGYRLGLSWL